MQKCERIDTPADETPAHDFSRVLCCASFRFVDELTYSGKNTCISAESRKHRIAEAPRILKGRVVQEGGAGDPLRKLTDSY